MDVIQIEMIHKRQNENIAVFLAHGDLYFLMLYCARCSTRQRAIRRRWRCPDRAHIVIHLTNPTHCVRV
jgi:hypothetical protein